MHHHIGIIDYLDFQCLSLVVDLANPSVETSAHFSQRLGVRQIFGSVPQSLRTDASVVEFFSGSRHAEEPFSRVSRQLTLRTKRLQAIHDRFTILVGIKLHRRTF